MRSTLALLLSAALSGYATAIPHGATAETRVVKCDSISKYTTPFFIQNRRVDPDDSTCIFYTFHQGGNAKRIGGFTNTIWDVWPCDLYNDDEDETVNPLACIMKDKKQRNTYFENMSRAFAQLCGVFVTVMTPDPLNVPLDGIWGRIEFPELQRTSNFDPPLSRVDFIDSTDPSMLSFPQYWTRPGLKARSIQNSTETRVVRRDEDCVPAGEVEKRFGDIHW